MQEAKKTIDSVIVDLEDYRDMNSSAFKEVNGTNYEVIEELRRNYRPIEKENASPYYDYRPQATPAFELPPQEDSLMLRSMLNEETKKNSALLLQMSKLDE